mmetsp:Transcript_78681/g.163614  ORF Transcript_78681/g.163614 Transcript_78681/m.163614 type:complete len:506 (-) Transcript_78681:186-1703(-)|eukprot:CAMPEP_0206451472 /NCGR_PEP_ID=MMETSP0324_2-20121206/19361_1 /ASSEMBLY_ACC=CAM_ASM_000836 /TAXON_ID=2866 /ORGANISM="Crypthecodinium cohnii, Strain Seligo" /LENGTH=505 /DNA_ID=CAMNT_0053921359 /DNA_START=38 /DNA_END=1555 /DNA_ORIENTATION=-
MGRQGRKRPREDGEESDGVPAPELRAPEELPEREANIVAASLSRWTHLRSRVEEVRPALEEEDRLMQEILSRGLGGEDRKMLRKLASGGRQSGEDEASELAAALGPDRDRLQDILMRNQRTLLELSASSKTDAKQDLLDEMEGVIDELRKIQETVHAELLVAKEKEDMAAVRSAGRSLNDLKALTRRLECERRSLTKNSALAALLVTVCRRVLPVRQIDPKDLQEVPPSHEGYLKILDFYFFSDASLYCFGEHYSGPNWFTRLKRNVAILLVRDVSGRILYDDFAVSGENKTPGAPPAPAVGGPLISIEAEDEHGRVFDRRHDAEFKLLTHFCQSVASNKEVVDNAKAELWSKKPLCRSCSGALRQVQDRFPTMGVVVRIGDPNAATVTNGNTLQAKPYLRPPLSGSTAASSSASWAESGAASSPADTVTSTTASSFAAAASTAATTATASASASSPAAAGPSPHSGGVSDASSPLSSSLHDASLVPPAVVSSSKAASAALTSPG